MEKLSYLDAKNRYVAMPINTYPRTICAVPDLPLPGPWARLKFRALSGKIEACVDTREPHSVGSRGPHKGRARYRGSRGGSLRKL